jgi:hypothetical protein
MQSLPHGTVQLAYVQPALTISLFLIPYHKHGIDRNKYSFSSFTMSETSLLWAAIETHIRDSRS